MALEEKVLQILGRGAITWDGLRAQLSANPDDLDAAIRNLEGSRQISRDRGRFQLNGVHNVTTQTAAAQASAEGEPVSNQKKKPCSDCGATKLLEEFPVNSICKDGHAGQCKACVSKKGKERRAAKQGTPAAAAIAAMRRPAPEASEPARIVDRRPPVAKAAIEPVMILHFADGVRIGPVHTSDAGIAQMPFHVDVSAEQLDELVTWWTANRKSA